MTNMDELYQMMMTTVVSVKVKHIRPAYDNLKEWMADPQNVYIGRGRIVFIDGERYPPDDSVWANPFKIDRDGTRDEVLAKYRKYIVKKIDEGLRDELLALEGKRIGCWCLGDGSASQNALSDTKIVCHGQIIVELIDLYR